MSSRWSPRDFADLGAPAFVQARRAAEIAAAGGHGLLLTVHPDLEATLLARCLPGLLPPLSVEEQVEVTWIHVAASVARGPITQRPFRAPHHSVSEAALAGSSRHIGEVLLAHRGVLYLDDLREFSPQALRAVRRAVEAQSIALRGHLYPLTVLLVGSTWPCPCGWYGSAARACSCTLDRIRRYRAWYADAIAALFDLHVTIGVVGPHDLSPSSPPEDTATIRARVVAARTRQAARRRIDAIPDRALRVARTICDLEDRDSVDEAAWREALALTRGAAT